MIANSEAMTMADHPECTAGLSKDGSRPYEIYEAI